MRDVILHLPTWLTHASSDISSPSTPAPKKLTIIYFITGNPGLIAYYEPFLELLARGTRNDAIIAGASLGGFETSNQTITESSIEDEILYPPGSPRKAIYDLKEQINLTRDRLNALVSRVQTDHPVTSGIPIEIVLIGHSVGAYISLELVHLQYSWSTSTSQRPKQTHPFKITATILLTPTIVDIAHSPSGRIVTPILSTIPFFPALLQLSTNALVGTMPVSWLGETVSRITGMKHGSPALEATVAFLRVPGAVKQALHMARSEMAEIGRQEWREEVWGASGGSDEAHSIGLWQGSADAADSSHINTSAKDIMGWKAPKHYFLFAKQDHWVADATRDSIVKAMGARATIVVDEPEQGEKGLVHAWCLDQSEMVANIVDGWLKEVIDRD